jgi:hypothetical protein
MLVEHYEELKATSRIRLDYASLARLSEVFLTSQVSPSRPGSSCSEEQLKDSLEERAEEL